MRALLTALVGGLRECGGDVWVHVDHRVPFQRHLAVSFLNSIVDPVNEPLAEDNAKTIDRVLPRPFEHLFRAREELTDLLIL